MKKLIPGNVRDSMPELKQRMVGPSSIEKERLFLDKCTMINPLPDVTTTIGTAFRNDKGLLFCIDIDKNPTEISVIAEIPNIFDISELHYDNFAVIQGEKGYGVVSATGNIIIDPVYKKVDWEAFRLKMTGMDVK